jgi:hypothetical protein
VGVGPLPVTVAVNRTDSPVIDGLVLETTTIELAFLA